MLARVRGGRRAAGRVWAGAEGGRGPRPGQDRASPGRAGTAGFGRVGTAASGARARPALAARARLPRTEEKDWSPAEPPARGTRSLEQDKRGSEPVRCLATCEARLAVISAWLLNDACLEAHPGGRGL